MTNCPIDCPTRTAGCQISCPISKAHEAEKHARYAKQQAERISQDIHINAILKAKRKRHLVYG